MEGVPEEGCLRNFGGGFREGARLFVVAPVRAIEKLQRRRQENEKGKSGGLINRMTRLKDGKGKQHEQRWSQRGKEKPKTQGKANREQAAHNVCSKQLMDDASQLKCGKH